MIYPKTKFIIPSHVAIIMDGNNRWTKKHKLKGFKGHEKGMDAIQNAINTAISFNVKFLTLFSFSSENWSRPKKEVKFLMSLLRKYLKNQIKKLMKEDISIKMIGDKKKLPKDIVKKINNYQKMTSKNKGLNLILNGQKQNIMHIVVLHVKPMNICFI